VAALVGAAVAVVVLLLRLVMPCGTGHLVTVRVGNDIGMRRRLLFAQHRGCHDPSQGQQHRQQHDNEDSERLHEVEASTVEAVTLCAAAGFYSTPSLHVALTPHDALQFRSRVTIGVTCQ
jgi:hypothetical protein